MKKQKLLQKLISGNSDTDNPEKYKNANMT